MTSKFQAEIGTLKAFRDAVWGDQEAFKPQGEDVEYLDLRRHLPAIRLLIDSAQGDGRLLVVADYREAIATFRSDINIYKEGARLVGNRGIGMSHLSLYFIIERLREQRPVAVQAHWTSGYLLFSEHGVTLHRDQDDIHPLMALGDSSIIWAISDNNEGRVSPVYAFLRASNTRVFLFSLPVRNDYWIAQRTIPDYFLNLWSKDEIRNLANLRGYPTDVAKRLTDKWGRVPYFVVCNQEQPEIMQLRISTIIEDISTLGSQPDNVFRALSGLDLPVDTSPQTVFYVKPRNATRSRHSIYIPTSYLHECVSDTIAHAAWTNTIMAYRTMATPPDTRAAAGWLYEQSIHYFFTSPSPVGKAITICETEGAGTESLQLPGLRVYRAKTDLGKPPESPFYWQPEQPNFPGIDSVIVTSKRIFAIQITLSSSHSDPQDGLNTLWHLAGSSLKNDVEWRMLFVGPDTRRIENAANAYRNKLKAGPLTRRRVVRVA